MQTIKNTQKNVQTHYDRYPKQTQKHFGKQYTNFLTEKKKTRLLKIRVITKLPNSEQSYKGKVKTHNYINRQNQSTTGKL
jgi:hypothetical protein